MAYPWIVVALVMKPTLLAIGFVLSAAVQAEPRMTAKLDGPVANAVGESSCAASRGTSIVATPGRAVPAAAQRVPPPDAADICRAGLALSKNRKLNEMTVVSNKSGVYTVSYVPWPNAPAGARTFRCKLAGNSLLWGAARSGKQTWSAERLSWALNPRRQELYVRVTFRVTGKSHTRAFPYDVLEEACNGCEGYQAAAPQSPSIQKVGTRRAPLTRGSASLL